MARTKTRIEIAEEYGISRRTLQRWLKKENIQLSNRLLTPTEQRRIYMKFGLPKSDRPADSMREKSKWR